MKPYAIVKCANCGKDVEVYHKNRLKSKHICCSIKCASEFKIKQNLNCTCPICGKKFHIKPYQLRKAKQELCCSYECMGKYRKLIYKGNKNPNYANTGDNNPLYKGYRLIQSGYYYVYEPNHPFASESGRIREHRLIAEKYLLKDKYSVTIDGRKYLSPEYDVHHIDENKLNNSPNNLMILTRSEHKKLHHQLKKEKLAQKQEI